MSDKEAVVRIGTEGADEAKRAAEGVKQAWSNAGTSIKSVMGGAADTVVKGLGGIASTALQAVTVVNTLNFAAAVEGAKRAEDATARMAVSVGQAVGEMQQRIVAASKATGNLVSDDQVRAIAQNIRRATGDLDGAVASIKGLNEAALDTGRSAEEMAPLGVVLHNVLGVAGDTSEEFGVLKAQAEKMGTVGGVAALHDQLVATAGALSMVSAQSDDARNKVTALVAALGKGFAKEAQPRVANAALGAIQGNAQMISMDLGYDILDEQGHVKDPAKVLRDLDAHMKRRGMNQKDRLFAWRNFAGPEAGSRLAQMAATNFADIDEAAAATPDPTAGLAAAIFGGTAAGQRQANANERDRNLRQQVKPLVDAQDALGAAFKDNPLLGGAVGAIATGIGMRGAGALAKGGLSLLRGGAAAAESAGAASAGGAGAAGATAEAAALAESQAMMGGLVTAGGATAAGIIGAGAIAAGGTVLGAGQLLGENRDTMGARWRAEHQDDIDRETAARTGKTVEQVRADRLRSDATAITRAYRGSDTDQDFLRQLGPDLTQRIGDSPVLQKLVEALENGVGENASPEEMGAALARGLQQSGAPIKVQVVEMGPPAPMSSEDGAQ